MAQTQNSPLGWRDAQSQEHLRYCARSEVRLAENLLHWHGTTESIRDICAGVPIHFVIANGIVAMEGNGPLQRTSRCLGKIVPADDPVAADAACARLMRIESSRDRTHRGSRTLSRQCTLRSYPAAFVMEHRDSGFRHSLLSNTSSQIDRWLAVALCMAFRTFVKG